jgi:hypothetical protein
LAIWLDEQAPELLGSEPTPRHHLRAVRVTQKHNPFADQEAAQLRVGSPLGLGQRGAYFAASGHAPKL